MSAVSKTLYKVLDHVDQLPEGRVSSVTVGRKTYCLARYGGKISCLDNKCPHQGGPLGEGSIENGLLRCPWHGWDFDPITGKAPGFDDGVPTFPVKIQPDGVYIEVDSRPPDYRTVSDVMVETMIGCGVDTVFGMVGHSNLGLAEAMRKQEKKGKLRFIAIRHEGAGSFAASAFGKLTGRPAACFGIAGPGSTNMFTGMYDAKQDRAPLLALSGQVQTQVMGTGAFQEVDLVEAFQGVASFNHRVQNDSKHGELMLLAIKHALIQSQVAHLTFPDEVQVLKSSEDAVSLDSRIADQRIIPPADIVEKATGMILQARQPVIIVGHGARFHMDSVRGLAETLKCPVMTSFKGKGLIADDHPLGCGVLGRSGTPIASYFMNESDLVLALGISFSNHTGITSKIPTIQVDFDRQALAKFHKIDLPIWGELGETLQLIRGRLDGEELKHADRTGAISERWRIWKEEKDVRLSETSSIGLSSSQVFHAMNRHTPSDACIAVDVGNHAYSFGRYFETRQQSIVMSGYLGSIGFGYPAAMGLWAAQQSKASNGQGRPIFAVTGDGGFTQYLGEITTAVKYNMPIKHILLNNYELAKISKEQRNLDFDVWETGLVNPDFSKFSQNCGALGVRVRRASELDEAFERVVNHPGPATLEILTDPALI